MGWTTLEVVAVQCGVTTGLGTLPRCATSVYSNQNVFNYTLTPAPKILAPGPVLIQMYTNSFIDAAYMSFDNVRIEY